MQNVKKLGFPAKRVNSFAKISHFSRKIKTFAENFVCFRISLALICFAKKCEIFAEKKKCENFRIFRECFRSLETLAKTLYFKNIDI